MATLDLDKKLSQDGVDFERKTVTKKVKLFGREWTVRTEINAFTTLAIGDGENMAAGLREFLSNIVVEEERTAWRRELASRPLDGDALMKIVDALTTVVAGNDSKKSSGSGTGRSTRSSAAS